MSDHRYISVYYYRDENRPNRPHKLRWPNRDWYAGSGQPEQFTRSYPTREAAMRHRAAIERELNDPAFAAGLDRTWAMAVADYADTLTGVSRKHRYDIDRCLAAFARLARPPRLSLISASMIDRYFAERATEMAAGWSPAQHRKEFSILRAFLTLHTKRRALPANPIDGVRAPIVPTESPRVPTDAEWIALLEAVGNPSLSLPDRQSWHVYILMAAVTGLDQMDLLRIRWTAGELQLGGESEGSIGLLHWKRTKSARRGTAGRTICIGLPPELNNRLMARFDAIGPEISNVFPWRSFQRKQWELVRAVAHFNYPFKSLRRVAATRTAESAALAAAATQLGHSSPEITRKHYVAGDRVAVAMASRLTLPPLPPLPAYSAPGQRVGERRRRHTKSCAAPPDTNAAPAPACAGG